MHYIWWTVEHWTEYIDEFYFITKSTKNRIVRDGQIWTDMNRYRQYLTKLRQNWQILTKVNKLEQI